MATQDDIRRAKELLELEKELAGIRAETLEDQRSIANALQDSIAALKFERTERNEIRSISKQISRIASEAYAISVDDLGAQKNIANIQKQQATLQQKLNILANIRKDLQDGDLKGKEVLLSNLAAQEDSIRAINAGLKETLEESTKINKNFAVKGFAITEDIVGAIPGLRQFKGTFEEAAQAARSVSGDSVTTASRFAAGAKSIGKAAVAALPLLVLTEVIGAFLKLDKGAGEIGKQLGISHQQSLALQSSLTETAAVSGDIFVTTENLRKSFLAINSALGLRATIDAETLKTQTLLTERAGYSVEAATQIATLSAATNQTSEDLTKEFLGQAAALNAQEGLMLSEKQLLDSINKLSGQTLATFGAQSEELAKSVFAAAKLGLELQQIEKIADGFLDIESSITKEFEAEVLLGKQLNFERARLFALQNDLAGVANELTKQGITQESFAKMNRLQQEAAANALNMSADEMGKMLIEQKAIAAMSGVEGKTAQERFNNLVKEVGLTEAKKQLGDESLTNQLESVSAQEQFTQLMSKLRESVVALVTPLLPVISGIASVVSLIAPLIPTLMTIIGIVTGNPLLIVGGLASLYQQVKGVGDAILPAEGGPIVSTMEGGIFQGTNNDDVLMGPGLARGGRNQGLSKEDISAIAVAVKDGASRANINLDGGRVSNRIQPPLAMNTRKYSV